MTDENIKITFYILNVYSVLCFTHSYLESAHNSVLINHIVVIIISSLSSVQVEGVKPVLKATELTLQLFIVNLR